MADAPTLAGLLFPAMPNREKTVSQTMRFRAIAFERVTLFQRHSHTYCSRPSRVLHTLCRKGPGARGRSSTEPYSFTLSLKLRG